MRDFYFKGDDYRYRFESEAKRRFIEVLREQFTSGVNYKGRILKWDTVIEQKANELGRFLVGKMSTLDFSEPARVIERADSRAIRETILSLTQSEANKRWIRKSTFHYLRKNARQGRSFKLYDKVQRRLTLSR